MTLSRKFLLYGLVGTLFIGVAGTFYISYENKSLKSDAIGVLSQSVNVVAATVDMVTLENLSATENDLKSPEYHLISKQLMNLQDVYKSSGIKGFYIMREVDGDIRFVADSAKNDDPWHSVPGTVYENPPAELSDIFTGSQIGLIGPYTDEYGSFYSFYTTLKNNNGEILAVVGVDIVDQYFYSFISKHQLLSVSIVLLIVIIYILVIFLLFKFFETSYILKQKNIVDEEIKEKIKQEVLSKGEAEKKTRELSDTKKAVLNILEDVQVAKAKNDAVIASLNDGVAIGDNEGKLVYFNETGSKILGMGASSSTSDKWSGEFGLFDPVTLQAYPAERLPLALALKGEVVKDTILFVRNANVPDGLFISVSASPIVLNNKPEGAVAIFRDITKVREIDKAKTEFVSLASHQLRTPLTSIKLFIELLLGDKKVSLSSKQKEYLQNIQLSTKRMVQLVNDLLNVSRLESGRLTIAPEPTDLAGIIKNVLVEVTGIANERKVKITFNEPSEFLPKIPLDPSLAHEMLISLVSNAIRYSKIKAGVVQISLVDKNDEYQVSVQDNGIGIPLEAQSKIFAKFFRADNAVTQEADGSGLGLYIAKMIMDTSGGRIWFESAVDKGTIFSFAVPKTGMKENKGERKITTT